MTYKKEIKEKAMKMVDNGGSLRQTAKELNIPLSTIASWCNKKNIKSSYKKYKKKATDKEILNLIEKKLVSSEQELEKEMGYSKNGLRNRLLSLVEKQKLNYVVLPGGKGPILKEYVGRRLYFIDKKHLKKWLSNKMPSGLPKEIKKAISQKLHNAGIDFSFEKSKKKAIVIDANTYKELEAKAKKKGVSVTDLVRNI